MGVETAKLPSFKDLEVEIPTKAPSMSQGFHKGNIFSFSDEFERPQQNHIAQQSRRDKLRVQQHGFEAAAAAASVAAGHPLAPIHEVEEEESGIYGPAGTNNMLSEMFNFPAPASELHLTGEAGASSTAVGYHRLIQRKPEDSFYGCNRPDQVLMSPSTTSWSSVLGEDSAAAMVKHLGMNPDSCTGMRRFFVNSSSAGVGIQPAMQQPSPSPPPPASMGGGSGVVGSLHHHHHNPPHSQTFLGHSFGEGLNLDGVGGGSVMERHLGASLSLSSSVLQQLEMRKAEDEMRVSRSEQGGRFFLNSSSSNEHEEDELHPSSVHQLRAPQPFLQQQAHMSYGAVATLNIFRNSLYARAAQELLEEFCSVGRGHVRGSRGGKAPSSNPNSSHIRGGPSSSAAAATASSSSSKEILPLSSADRFENQRKKAKLLSMLDEVERRYNHYCEQMQMVVNSFDSVMGFGAATPYTALAQKAMSRHFRCLKDAITGQLKQTCELLGDREGAINGSGGLTKGDTPKLRLIDQSLRQQRAFHQLGMMDQDQAWRPQRGLPDRSVTILRAWLFDHFLHPYPSDADKHLLARQTGLSRNQVSNWFINARVRLWKPMVEDMYQQEAKEAKDSQQQQQQHINDETNTHSTTLAAPTTRQHQSISAAHNPTLVLQSDSPECAPMPTQNLCALSAPVNTHPQPQPEDDDAAASALIFSPGTLHNDMYGRPAPTSGPSAAATQTRFGTASTTARTGDLSLTLGLRHAGLNPPETGRFGL